MSLDVDQASAPSEPVRIFRSLPDVLNRLSAVHGRPVFATHPAHVVAPPSAAAAEEGVARHAADQSPAAMSLDVDRESILAESVGVLRSLPHVTRRLSAVHFRPVRLLRFSVAARIQIKAPRRMREESRKVTTVSAGSAGQSTSPRVLIQ